MADKKKTAAVKKDADKAVDEIKDVAEQPAKEQPKAQEKAPVEQKPQPAPEPKTEPKAETPAQPAPKPQGIATSDKDGINVENKGDQIIITYPNRKDINYAFNEGAVGMKNSIVKWDKATIHDKLFDMEPLQTKTVAYNAADLTPDFLRRLIQQEQSTANTEPKEMQQMNISKRLLETESLEFTGYLLKWLNKPVAKRNIDHPILTETLLKLAST